MLEIYGEFEVNLNIYRLYTKSEFFDNKLVKVRKKFDLETSHSVYSEELIRVLENV